MSEANARFVDTIPEIYSGSRLLDNAVLLESLRLPVEHESCDWEPL